MGINKSSISFTRRVATLVMALGVAVAYSGAAEAAPQYSLNCASCHQMPPTDSPDAKKKPATGAIPGNHQKHATASANSCTTCHGDGVTGYGTSHRNQVIELSDSLGYGRKQTGVPMDQVAVPPNPLGSCTTALCHSNGKNVYRTTPPWNSLAPATCDTCHDAKPASASHTKHVSSTSGYNYSCDKCHTNHTTFQHATSAGRAIDVHFSTSPNSGGSFASNQCSNLYCHSNGKAGAANITAAPAWIGGTATCSSCHGNSTSNTLSGKHANHVNNSAILGSNYGCVMCHSATVSDNATISSTTNHVDGSITVAGNGIVVSGSSCATSYCHSDGKGGSKTVTWTQTAPLGCDGCHGTAASFGAPAYATGAAGSATANSHAKHATSAVTCANCHSKTTSTGLAIIVNSQHTDGFRNFTSGNGVTFGKQANLTCSNISCHNGGGIVKNVPSAQWGATLGCNGCHGNTDTTLTTGSHPRHLLKGLDCQTCHANTVTGSTTIIVGGSHTNSAANVVGSAGILTYTPATSSCATVCHKNTIPVWGSSTTGSCGSCHSVAPAFSIGFTTKPANQPLHDFHFSSTNNGPKMSAENATGCQVCHSFTDDLGANHNNGAVNLNTGFGTTNTACGTCHKQTTSWVNAQVTCESCHSTAGGALSVINKTAPDKTMAATLGHGKAGIGQACTVCHNRASQHIGVAGGTTRLLSNYSTSEAGVGCNNCHNSLTNPLKKNMQVHQVSGLGSTCNDCHNPHGTTNSMMVNTTINGTTVSYTGTTTFANNNGNGVCQVCHTKTLHFKAGVVIPPQTHVDSTSNCLDCHKHNPTDGSRAFSASGNCDSCHGYPPAPRKVAGLPFTTFGTQGQWSSARFEDYSGGGGAHVVAAHIPKTARPSEGWTNCTPCHTGGSKDHAKVLPVRDHVENVTVSVDPQLRFSDDALATYTSAKLVSGSKNKSGSCFNVNCHFTTTFKWSEER